MGKIYNLLGLSVGCITNSLNESERKKNYACDITYGTNNEFGFDYLRDNMVYNLNQMVQRDHFFCIVDEVDSILIDEARTPLVISGITEDKSDQYFVCNKFVKELDKSDYEIDEKDKNVLLSNKGIDKIEKISKSHGILKNNNIYDPRSRMFFPESRANVSVGSQPPYFLVIMCFASEQERACPKKQNTFRS